MKGSSASRTGSSASIASIASTAATTTEQPKKPADFGALKYWDDEYQFGKLAEPFDWVADWEDMRAPFMRLVPQKDVRILIPGCGNAPSLLQMYDEGYTNLVCGDYSMPVIEQMRAASDRAIQWDFMDATCMPYPDASFDVVLDKSLVDCLHCCDEPLEKIRRYIDEVFRVLTPGGIFMSVCFQSKEEMKSCLRGRAWISTTESLAGAQLNRPEVAKTEDRGEKLLKSAAVHVVYSVCVKEGTTRDGQLAAVDNVAVRSKNGKMKQPVKAMTRRQERMHLAEQAIVDAALHAGVDGDDIEEAIRPPSTNKGSKDARKKAEKNARRMQHAIWAAEDM